MTNKKKVALVTGAAHRIGKSIAQELHRRNIDVALHCGRSLNEANSLSQQLNRKRKNSAHVFQFDLSGPHNASQLVYEVQAFFGRLDYLVNNASLFYPVPLLKSSAYDWYQFSQINVLQPTKMVLAAAEFLKENRGAVVNLLDIYTKSGLANHCHYVASKQALQEMTKVLADQLSPNIRVNAVSPGAILWPESTTAVDQEKNTNIVENTALKKRGKEEDISNTVAFLLLDATYSTGSLINVDGGRRLYI